MIYFNLIMFIENNYICFYNKIKQGMFDKMKTIILFIFLTFVLIGCGEQIVNNNFASNIPTGQTLRDPHSWTLLRFNGGLTLLVDSVQIDIPNQVITTWAGIEDVEHPLGKNTKIQIIEPQSAGYKMVQGNDTTGIDSVSVDSGMQQVRTYNHMTGLHTKDFVNLTTAYKIYTVTY